MKDTVVYTTIIGNYDTLKPFPFDKEEGVRYVLITDNKNFKSNFWEVIVVPSGEEPRRQSRESKILSHKYFPEAKITIYIDGNRQFTRPIKYLVSLLGDYDLLARKHFGRTCLYDEAKIVQNFSYVKKGSLVEQMNNYVSDGFPKDYGLLETNILIRKNNVKIKEFNDLWFKEYSGGCVRDQTSMMYCLWKTNTKWETLFYDATSYEPHKRSN